MYCPQCGTESASTLQFCRLCGANLKVIGKAVTLSEAIARSDRGPLPRLKEMVRGLKIDHVTDEISGALDKMKEEIARSSEERRPRSQWWLNLRDKKTPERRREEHRVKGTIGFFSGIGLMVFLYSLGGALVLKLPPEVLAKIPFELNPLIHVLWTVGMIPTLTGLGHLVGSFFVKSGPAGNPELAAPAPQTVTPSSPSYTAPTNLSAPSFSSSVTEHTTNLLTSDQVTGDTLAK